MRNPLEKLTLGLETGLDGGSVSILEKGRQIDGLKGAGNLSKSEDLLLLIDTLLRKNGIGKKDLGMIGISDEPGSLTGIRIGLAIARGLGDSLAAEVYRVPILEALTYAINFDGRILSALYTERKGIFFREFLKTGGRLESFADIYNETDINKFAARIDILRGENVSLVFTRMLAALLKDCFGLPDVLEEENIFTVEGNPAEIIGIAAHIKTRPIITKS